MRILAIVLIAAVLVGAGYFFLNVQSYEPSTGTTIQALPEQNVDDLVQASEAPVEAAPADLVPDMEKARAVVTQAFDKYSAYKRDLPRQAQETISLIIRLMAKGKLPTYFVDVKQAGYEADRHFFEPIEIDPFNISHLNLTQGRAMCNEVPNSSGDQITALYKITKDANGRPAYECAGTNCPAQEYFDVMIGDTLGNKFLCDPKLTPLSGDQVYLGGPGDDVIKHTKGNVIIDGGSGNDTVALGRGRKVMIMSQGWGQDTINIDCTGAQIDKTKLPPFALPWEYEYTNFLVFGTGIQPEDLKFDGLEIQHIVTRDKVTFSDYCFNIVFTEDFQQQGIPDKID
jgi:hypothetical protein